MVAILIYNIFKMKNNPLISVIVPTKNSAKFLNTCLNSVKKQSYKNIEIIVVDNNSTDNTKEIAKKMGAVVYNKGPERSAQVNFGVSKAKGLYIYKIDSDFILEKNVIKQCVDKVLSGVNAVVVHNTPDESISWIARIRKFEVDMYKNDLTHASARFISKKIFKEINGFNPLITAGEDYDFQNKINNAGYKTEFIEAEAIHLGEPTHFWPHMKKYYIYGKDFVNFTQNNKKDSKKQLSFFRPVYLKNWKKFVTHPIISLEFIFYNFCKYCFGGAGYIMAKIKNK